jgi:hypothetical protein
MEPTINIVFIELFLIISEIGTPFCTSILSEANFSKSSQPTFFPQIPIPWMKPIMQLPR